MTFPVCRLVAAPEVSARVYLDLNDQDSGIVLSGDSGSGQISFGEPVFTSSPWAIQEGTRKIELPLVIMGDSARVSSIVSNVARVLSRSQVWLQWQSSERSRPVWFRLIRDAVGALDFQNFLPVSQPGTSVVWEWPLTLTAHAFAYGELVTLPSVTLGKNGSGATPFTAALPPILGDAPSMARIDITPQGSQSWMGYQALVNVSASDTQSGFVGAPNAAVGGFGSYDSRCSRVTAPSGLTSYDSANKLFSIPSGWAANSTVTVDSGGWPNTPPPGQYRAFMRVGRNAAGGAYGFQFGPSFFNYPLYQAISSWTPPDGDAAVMSWVDCGQVTLPTGMDPSMLFDSDVIPNPSVSVGVTPIDNSKGVYLDQIILIPTRLARGGTCTTAQLQFQGISVPSNTSTLRIDGDYQRIGFRLNGFYQNVAPPLMTGGFPVLSPGFNNWVSLLQNTTESFGGCEDATEKITVQVSYYPRYMHLGG